MKKFIAAAAMLAISSVQAEELKFGDLNFFIPVGQFNLAAQVDFVSSEQESSLVVTESEGWVLGTNLTYGVTDKLNLFAGLNYHYDVEVANESASQNKPYNQDGLANPVVGGIFRLLDQNESWANLDLGASGILSVEDEEVGAFGGSSPKDGNAARGRNALELFARSGKKWNEANEWQVAAGVVHHFEGESTRLAVAGANTDYDLDSSTDAFVRAAYQYRPVNEFMIALIAQGTQVGEQVEENTTTNVETTFDSHFDLDFTFQAKYLITSNFIANFTLVQSRYSDYKGDVAGTSFDVEKRKASVIGAGVDWLF